MVFSCHSHHLQFLVDKVPLFCCVSPGRMFSGTEVHFSASFPPASSLQVLLAAHLGFFFCLLAILQMNLYICSQAVSMCFIYLQACLHSPFFIFFLSSCYIDFVPTA